MRARHPSSKVKEKPWYYPLTNEQVRAMPDEQFERMYAKRYREAMAQELQDVTKTKLAAAEKALTDLENDPQHKRMKALFPDVSRKGD